MKLYFSIIISFFLFASQAQENSELLNLKQRESLLKMNIKDLSDSLSEIQEKIKSIENLSYLEQFKNSSDYSIDIKCIMEGKLRKDPIFGNNNYC